MSARFQFEAFGEVVVRFHYNRKNKEGKMVSTIPRNLPIRDAEGNVVIHPVTNSSIRETMDCRFVECTIHKAVPVEGQEKPDLKLISRATAFVCPEEEFRKERSRAEALQEAVSYLMNGDCQGQRLFRCMALDATRSKNRKRALAAIQADRIAKAKEKKANEMRLESQNEAEEVKSAVNT